MSDNRKRVKRRRSIRLRRQSLQSTNPDPETVGNEFFENTDSSSVHCLMFNVTQALDSSGGSTWVEVDANEMREARKSRRSNIGYHIAKCSNDDDHIEEASVSKAEGTEPSIDSPDIEVLRRPCPDASPCMQTPHSILKESKYVDISEAKTPGFLPERESDKSLPTIQTPVCSSTSASQSNLLPSFDDVLVVGFITPSDNQNLNVSCPPSCEDESEDSLLICTPDLAKFKKNIRFKCSLDFTELDQTPGKSDNPADKSQESIHESPIVGYVYDKLNASDVTRRRRSNSLQEHSKTTAQNYNTAKRFGTPKRLPLSSVETESSISNHCLSVKQADVAETSEDVEISPIKLTQEECVEIQSKVISTAGTPLSCTYDDLEVSVTSPLQFSAQAESTPSQVSVSPDIKSTCISNTCVPINKLGDCDSESLKENKQNGETDLGSDVASMKMTEDIAEQELLKQADDNLQHSSKKKNIYNSKTTSENKTKDRNIASDVCDMFRSLARRFSGRGKAMKRRKSVEVKKGKDQKEIEENSKKSIFAEGSPISAGDGEIFSFRKEPKLLKQATDVAKSPKNSEAANTLDFSPFLPTHETCDNGSKDCISSPVSPVWKLQSDVNSESVVDSITYDNYPLITETVLQENYVNTEVNEQIDQPVAKKRGRPKRRSIEASVLQQECKEFQANEVGLEMLSEEDDKTSLRRSRRSRRSSLEIFKYQENAANSTGECQDTSESESDTKTKKTRGRKKAEQSVSENLEELYRNKNYKLPGERMWETLFESPEKTKQPGVHQSKRRYRRTITFDTVPPAKIRKRLEKAASQGWDITGKKRKSIPLEEVKTKMALLAAEIEH